MASLLLSADLYCRAGSLILKSDAAKPLLGHDAVIQALAQRGLYVTDQERLVTERDLRKRPLQMVREFFFEPFLSILETMCLGYTINSICRAQQNCVLRYAFIIVSIIQYIGIPRLLGMLRVEVGLG